MQDELKQRINELALKKKNEGLTVEEQAEQDSLYRVYIDELKDQLKISLHKAGYAPKE